MKRCSVCGADIREGARYCDQCGAPIPGACEGPPRDFWAERLAADTQDPKAAFPQPDPEDKPRSLPDPGNQTKCRRYLLPAVLLFLTLGIALAVWLLKPTANGQDPNLGTYYGVLCALEGTTLEAEGDWVELRPRGKAKISLMGSIQNGTWRLRDGELTLDCGGQQLTGTLGQGVMQLRDAKLQYTLAKPEAAENLSTATEARENYDSWAGDYYGWWSIWTDEEPEDDFWDVCGRITVEGSQGQVTLWDTTCQPGELLCLAEVEFFPGSTPRGCLRSLSGRFRDRELEPGDWDFDPGITIVKNLDGAVMLLGDYQPKGQCLIFLLPWGMDWEAVEQMEEKKKPYLDMLPAHYADWYLPKIREGKTMPDHFPKHFLREKTWE